MPSVRFRLFLTFLVAFSVFVALFRLFRDSLPVPVWLRFRQTFAVLWKVRRAFRLSFAVTGLNEGGGSFRCLFPFGYKAGVFCRNRNRQT